MEKGYSYINENGKVVRGRAADNHWMSEHGYHRLADVIDAAAERGARRAASEIKAELDVAAANRSKITKTTRSA